MKKIHLLRLLVLALFATALSSCDDDGEIRVVTLEGFVGGEPWTMKFGKAEAEDIDPGFFSLFLPTETVETTPCDVFLPNTNYISATLPRTPGTYSLPFLNARQFAFRANGQFILPVSGSVEITSVEGGTIRGRIDAQADDENYVFGDFILFNCPVF